MTAPVTDRPPHARRYGERQPVIASAVVIAAVFAAYGAHSPFFPLLLRARGLDEQQIALVLSAPMVLRFAVAPLIGALADRRADRRGLVAGTVLVTLCCALGVSVASGFYAIFACATVMMLAYQPVQPITDATVGMLVRRGIARDYGRLRLWGSASFAVVAVLGGFVLEWGGIDRVFRLYMLLLALVIASAVLLPATEPVNVQLATRPFRLLQRPALLLVLVVVALVNASQALYFSFGSAHMLAIGYPEWSVGVLWTLAVLAEIVVLWFAPSALLRFGPYVLLMVAACGTALRWGGMALDPPLSGMVVLQLFHAATLSCTYLALMGFIHSLVEPEATARAQSAATTLTGLMMAAMTLAMGPAYRSMGGTAYLVSALLPAVAALLLIGFRGKLTVK